MSMEGTYEPPCLDGLSDDDLGELHEVYSTMARLTLQMQVGRILRREGRIEAAIKLETMVERLYNKLPKWARW